MSVYSDWLLLGVGAVLIAEAGLFVTLAWRRWRRRRRVLEAFVRAEEAMREVELDERRGIIRPGVLN